jgi:ribosomal-protein-alanine N-acetyltransferase
MKILLESPRFYIRQFLPEEEHLTAVLVQDPTVNKYLPKRSDEENHQIFMRTINDYSSESKLGRWGIFNKADADFIGICLLRVYNNDQNKIEVGYVMHQKYWGKGIASEIAKMLVDYALKNTQATEIVAVTELENSGSQRVLEKAGLIRKDNFTKGGLELACFQLKRSV